MTSTTRRALPALLLSAVVLAVAFAGGATAAKLITGKQIKDNTVTTQDIRNRSLKGADVKDGSLVEADLNAKVKGKLNAPSVKGFQVVEDSVEVPTASEGTAYVACPAGKLAMGGGGSWENLEVATAIKESAPQRVFRGDALLYGPAEPGLADGWKVHGEHNGLDAQDLTAWVICVSPN